MRRGVSRSVGPNVRTTRIPPPDVLARTRPAASLPRFRRRRFQREFAPECSRVILPPPCRNGPFLHRSNADVPPPVCSVALPATDPMVMWPRPCSRTTHGNILGNDVAARGFQMRGAADILSVILPPEVERPTRLRWSWRRCCPPPVETSTLEFSELAGPESPRGGPHRAAPSFGLQEHASAVARAEIGEALQKLLGSFCEASVSRWTWYATVPVLSEFWV